VPHITSGRSVMIRPAWAGSPFGGPSRRGARSPCWRISRRTRFPLTTRSRWAGPDLSVALTVERARSEDGLDPQHDLGVAPPSLRPPFPGRPPSRRRRLGRVHAGARDPEDLTDEGQRIAPPGARADGRAHPLRLFHSSMSPLFSIRYSASSSRIVSSPTLARANVSSRSSGSLRLLSPRPPASRVALV
jgi:hypothetical protein